MKTFPLKSLCLGKPNLSDDLRVSLSFNFLLDWVSSP